MTSYDSLLENNRRWAAECVAQDPDCFSRLTDQHAPDFLYIGCSDARVPANIITGTDPGDMFVHRNIANQVMHTDPNMMAVLQYAVDVLKVKDVIVCGHEGCGGVKAAMGELPHAQVDAWLSPIRTVARLHEDELHALPDDTARYHRLVELNVLEQVRNLSRSQTVMRAWERGQPLQLHGWAYDLHVGLIRDLGTTIGEPVAKTRADRASRVDDGLQKSARHPRKHATAALPGDAMAAGAQQQTR